MNVAASPWNLTDLHSIGWFGPSRGWSRGGAAMGDRSAGPALCRD